MRKYGRNDVSYDSWYSDWSRRLASVNTMAELEDMLYGAKRDARVSAASHLRAISATCSMAGQSARRAHARNVTAAAGDYAIALSGALEIHELFPENAKSG